MSETSDKIAALQARLENLVKSQAEFQREVNQIRQELHAAHISERNRSATPPAARPPIREPEPTSAPPPPAEGQSAQAPPKPAYDNTPNFGYNARSGHDPGFKTDDESHKGRTQFEKFVGENLISKIGIAILVIGVGIGTKYAIDNNLISPLTRIILGYVMGFGLVGFAIKLKPKYLNFSAVLISGGMAIMYFVTYFAYSLYHLIDQSSAFALMVMFTVFTIAAALIYSRQIIAHIGLVGAYAVPFLLSDDSGRYAFLFTYIALINGGILAVSVRRYWKSLFYTSFIFTWLIYYAWFMEKYDAGQHFSLAFVFLFIFFAIFYATFLVYKLVSDQNLAVENVGLVTANAFIFYGFGYALLEGNGFESYLGLFTIGNAAVHLLAGFGASRVAKIPVDMIYLLGALVLTFATIAVPVQLEGRSVTLIWSAEAAILFAIGRIKQIRLYEYYSFPLIAIATLSLFANWVTFVFDFGQPVYPIANGLFVTGLFYVTAMSTIFYLNRNDKFDPVANESVRAAIKYIVGSAALLALYNVFRMEIANYFEYIGASTARMVTGPDYTYSRADPDLSPFNYVWQINYTMVFLAVLGFVNTKRVRDIVLASANIVAGMFALFIFLTVGLYMLGELRESYLLGTGAEYYTRSSFHIIIRYISLTCVGALLLTLHEYSADEYADQIGGRKLYAGVFDFVLHLSLLILLSSELIHWMDIFGYVDSYKLGLSILWGVYALALVGIGISRGKQHLRIGAIVLLAVTLAKLFLYDIRTLSTVARTVVFVSLGILMLIVSFLYNKYKTVMFGTDET